MGFLYDVRGIETYCAGAIRAMPGFSPSAFAVFARRCTPWPACARGRCVKARGAAERQYIRNLILIAHALHDTSFTSINSRRWIGRYSADTKADPAATAKLAESLSPWTRNSREEFKAAQGRVNAVAASGQLGIFMNGYWAIRRCGSLRREPAGIHALRAGAGVSAQGFAGGRNPGIKDAAYSEPDGRRRGQRHRFGCGEFAEHGTPGDDSVLLEMWCGSSTRSCRRCLRCSFNVSEWFKIGSGVKNYLAVPDLPLDSAGSSYELPGGTIMNGNIAGVHGSRPRPTRISAMCQRRCSARLLPGDKPLHPWNGRTDPDFTGWNGDQKYSWVKAPRFNGAPMQVGPLAQVLIGFAQGHPLTVKHATLASPRCRPSPALK